MRPIKSECLQTFLFYSDIYVCVYVCLILSTWGALCVFVRVIILKILLSKMSTYFLYCAFHIFCDYLVEKVTSRGSAGFTPYLESFLGLS